MSEDIGQRVVEALGEASGAGAAPCAPTARRRSAALIGRLYARDDARWLAELLLDLEDDVGEVARLRLVHDLRTQL